MAAISGLSDSSLAYSQSLGPVSCRHRRDDGHREPAVCLDPFHQAHSSPSARLAGGGSMDHRTLFVALETWLVPFEGFLVDRIGPRFMLGIGAILAGLGWIGSGYAETIYGLYFWYGLGGIGAGAVYGGTIGNALKWFPDHRGLCVGLTAGAFGIGTATTIAPVAAMLKTSGYQHTFIFWGIVQGFVVLVASLFLARPPVGWTPPNWKEKEAKIKAKVKTSAVDMTPWEMLRQPSFYVIYLMMTMLAFGGIVVTVQLNPMASSYHVDKVVVALGHDRVGAGHHGRPDPERVDASLLGMGLGPHWPRECHLHLLHPGGNRGICSAPTDQPSRLVRRLVRPVFLRLGQYLLVVPFDHRRPVRKANGPPPTMASCTRPREWLQPLPGPAPPGCLPRPAPGRRSSGR